MHEMNILYYVCERFSDETLGQQGVSETQNSVIWIKKLGFCDNDVFSLKANTKLSHGNIPKFMK